MDEKFSAQWDWIYSDFNFLIERKDIRGEEAITYADGLLKTILKTQKNELYK